MSKTFFDRWLRERGLTAVQFAAEIGMPLRRVRKWRSGVARPCMASIRRIASHRSIRRITAALDMFGYVRVQP